MTSTIQSAEPKALWRQFCIDLLSGRPNLLVALNIEHQSAEDFIRFLYQNGLESVLLDLLEQQSQTHLLPAFLLNDLMQIRRDAHIKEIYRKKHLQNLLHLLNENHIKCLILKGTAFAYSLYNQPYQRSRVDTDLLIRLEDKEKMDQVLVDTGFSKSMNISGDLISHQTTYWQTTHNINHAYDIHWKISNRNAYANRFEFAQLYLERTDLVTLDQTAFALNSINALLHSTVHYFGHLATERDRLIWLYDLHLLCRQLDNQQWHLFLQESGRKRLDPMCFKLLKRCYDTFNSAIPTEILEKLEHSDFQVIGIENKRIQSDKWTRINQINSDWKALNFNQRCLLVKEYLFPPAEFILHQNHSANKLLLPYFYLKRIVIGVVNVLANRKNL